MTSGKLVECGSFYAIKDDRYDAKYGVAKGQTVLVVGDGMFPVSEDDPYLYRKFFAIVKFENGTMDMEQKPLIVSADGLEEISDELQESFKAMLAVFEQQLEPTQ